jgi:hypothetical protein
VLVLPMLLMLLRLLMLQMPLVWRVLGSAAPAAAVQHTTDRLAGSCCQHTLLATAARNGEQ